MSTVLTETGGNPDAERNAINRMLQARESLQTAQLDLSDAHVLVLSVKVGALLDDLNALLREVGASD